MPRWLPALAGLSYALGFGLLGLAAFAQGSSRVAFAIAGALLCTINIASFALVARRWLRAGVLPLAAGSPRGLWLSTGIVPAPIAVAGLVWLLSDEIGWAAITLGVLLGASTWLRLSAETLRRNP
jgi:hypothetical protein